MLDVSVRNPDIDHLEEQDEFPWFTLDSIFFVEFLGEVPDELLKRFLGTMFRWNSEYYYSLIQQMVSGVDPAVVARALKWAQARLADKGFPDFDEALEIYHPVNSLIGSSEDQVTSGCRTKRLKTSRKNTRVSVDDSGQKILFKRDP